MISSAPFFSKRNPEARVWTALLILLGFLGAACQPVEAIGVELSEPIREDPADSERTGAAADPDGSVPIGWQDPREGDWESTHGQAQVPLSPGEWTPDERLTDDPAASGSPCIAADPLGDIHAVWHDERDGNFEVYHKRWDGVVWTEDERLTFHSADSPWPRLAADVFGNVHVVWYDYCDGNPAIYYKRFDGIAWGPDERLSEGSAWSVSPAVAVDALGQVHVVWYDNRDGNWELYTKHWDGISWTSDERLTNDTAESRYPLIAVDPSHGLHVVWQDRRDGNWNIYHKHWDNIGWSALERLTTDPNDSRYPAIAVDSDGNVHVVWQDDRDGAEEIYYRCNDGVSWSPEMRLSVNDANDSCRPSIAADVRGMLHVVWQDERDAANIPEIYYRFWNGVSWSEETRLTSSGVGAVLPWVATDGIGNIHVAWEDERDGNPEIYYKRRSPPEGPPAPPVLTGILPPSTWNFGSHDLTATGVNFAAWAELKLVHDLGDEVQGAVLQATDTSVVARFDLTGTPTGEWSVIVTVSGQSDTLVDGFMTTPSPWQDELRLTEDPAGSSLALASGRTICLDSDEALHLFWYDTRDGNQEIYWKTRSDSIWSVDERLTYNGSSSSHPVGAAGLDGSVLTVWQDSRDGNSEIYSKIRCDGVWFADERVTFQYAPSVYPSIAGDWVGTYHLVWQDGRTGNWEIYYSRMGDGVWGAPVRLSTDSHSSVWPSVICDAEARIYVVWADDRDGNWEIYSTKWSDGSWGPETRITTDAAESLYPSLGSYGEQVYVVWQENRDGNEEIYLRRLDVADNDHRLTDHPAVSNSPMLSITESGNLHIVWTDTRTGLPEIWYKFYDVDAGSWSLDHRMSGSHEEAALACLQAGPHNSIDVVWRDLRDGNYEIYSRCYRDAYPAGLLEERLVTGMPMVWCHPNPFRDRVSFSITVPSDAQALFQVFDAGGRKVRTLIDTVCPPGSLFLDWDGRSSDGRTGGAGVYFYRLDAGRSHQSGRIVRLR